MKHITFTCEETEMEFLKKLQEQWKIAASFKGSEAVKFSMLSGAFYAIDHRIDELEGEQLEKHRT